MSFDLSFVFRNATTKTTYTFAPKTYMRGVDTARCMQLFQAAGSSVPSKDAVDAHIHQFGLTAFFTITTTPL